MKKIALLMMAGLSLTACTTDGVTQSTRPYTITLEPLGYEVDDEGKITISSVRAELFSAAGAMDVRSVDYSAILLNSEGERAALNNTAIVPASGTMFGAARGGYSCRTTAALQCSILSSDYFAVDAGPNVWPQNAVVKAMFPAEWAVAHLAASGTGGPQDSAGWYAEFTYTAVTTNGQTVSWKQNYQVVAPAKGGA